jgi:phytanoyl-CoA hydroxylase
MNIFARNRWKEDGYFIASGICSSLACEEIKEKAQDLSTSRDGSFRPCMQPHRHELFFLRIMRIPSIVKTMEVLLGGDVSVIQSQYFFCKPGTPGFTAHQDNFYVRSNYDTFGSAWLALDDVGPENGGLIVYKGSHVEPLLPVQKVEQGDNKGQDPNANYQEAKFDRKKYAQIDVRVKAGSVVFIHGHVLHGSHDNTSNNSRNVILMTYIRKGSSFREGFAAKRCEIDVK